MVRSPKLKVFRTAIGFHDAYVAVPSRKAALEAWGAKSDLFAHGIAEIITDAKLTRAALAAPGEVIKVSRGTPAEQLAALSKAEKARAAPNVAAKVARKSAPRPSRSKLDTAEASLAALGQRHADDRAALDREEQALRKRQAALRGKQDREQLTAETKRDAARAAYDRAMDLWRRS